jgi:tetratricopeptide (TPR) repeat protein
MKRYLTILFFLLAFNIFSDETSQLVPIYDSMHSCPTEFISAGIRYYQTGEFETALEMFYFAIKSGIRNPDLFFNIGNTYFRLENIPNAIIYYKRALLLNSAHVPSRQNLDFVLSITTDRQITTDRGFMANFFTYTINRFSINSLLLICLILLSIIILIIHIQWRFPHHDRTVYRFINFMILFLFIVTGAVATLRITLANNNSEAVVTQSIVYAFSGPSEAFTRLFTIHSGAVLRINQEENGWSQITTLSGFTGWIQSDSFSRVRE